jgi:hypothetical protein
MMAIIARTKITPITMPAMAPAESPFRVWAEVSGGGIVAFGEAGLMIDEEVEPVEISTLFVPVVMVATLGGNAMDPVLTRFS